MEAAEVKEEEEEGGGAGRAKALRRMRPMLSTTSLYSSRADTSPLPATPKHDSGFGVGDSELGV